MGEKSAYERLRPQQRAFVDHYLIEQVPSRAARAASYHAPDKAGHRLMRSERVLAAIAEKMQGRNERMKIDADWVLLKSVALANANILDFCELLEDGTLKPTMTGVSREKAAAVLEFERKELADGSVTMKLKLVDPIRSLEMVGKHTDVRAFLERHSIEDGDDLAAAIEQMERRVREGRKSNGDARPEEERPEG